MDKFFDNLYDILSFAINIENLEIRNKLIECLNILQNTDLYVVQPFEEPIRLGDVYKHSEIVFYDSNKNLVVKSDDRVYTVIYGNEVESDRDSIIQQVKLYKLNK